MKKYAINKEFGIFRYLKIPVMPPKMAGFVGGLLRAPGWVFRSIEVEVSRQKIEGYQQGEIEVLCFSPGGVAPKAPCLVYYHGGGFFFGAAGYHYKLCMQYAAELGCKIVFVQYRLAPKSPFPIPVEDCYAAYQWTVSHADMLGIDVNRIAVGGDSAGGCLAAAVSLMLRDRGDVLPLFQLLIYPVTDRRMQTESNKKYTDTPMWHSRLSVKMWQSYLPDVGVKDICYASPMEARSFAKLPSAYLETAEYDCLHDEGLSYANALLAAGVSVEINQTQGTPHGFDIVVKAPTSKKAVARRIAYMRERFFIE